MKVKVTAKGKKTGVVGKILWSIVILAVISSLFGGDDADKSTEVEVLDVQTAGVQENVQKAEVKETPVETETPEPVPTETPEEDKKVSLEEAALVEETPVRDEKEDLEEEYRERLEREQLEDEDEEEDYTPYSGTSSSSTSSEDLEWASAMLSDINIVNSDMQDLSEAANNQDVTSLQIYADKLYESTQDAIDHNDEYDVSPDLQEAQDEFRSGMVSFHSAALTVYAGVEAYNSGDTYGATDSFNTAADLLIAGSERIETCTDLLNEYTETHS